MRPFWHAVVGGLRNESKRALTSNDDSLDHLNGIVCVEVHKRIQGVASGAFDGKFPADKAGQLLIALDF